MFGFAIDHLLVGIVILDYLTNHAKIDLTTIRLNSFMCGVLLYMLMYPFVWLQMSTLTFIGRYTIYNNLIVCLIRYYILRLQKEPMYMHYLLNHLYLTYTNVSSITFLVTITVIIKSHLQRDAHHE